MYKASIRITRRSSILDPQGKTVHRALKDLEYESIDSVRMGTFVEMWIDEDTEEQARAVAEEACQKLLANPVMEDFVIELAPEQDPAAA